MKTRLLHYLLGGGTFAVSITTFLETRIRAQAAVARVYCLTSALNEARNDRDMAVAALDNAKFNFEDYYNNTLL